jgi:hypothetical protein
VGGKNKSYKIKLLLLYMKKAKPFDSKNPTFSKKDYEKRKKEEMKKIKKLHKKLKKQYKEQEKKKKARQKNIDKTPKTKEVKVKKIKTNEKLIPSVKIQPKIEQKQISQKQIPKIEKKPSLQDLENYLIKLTDSYDENTIQIRKDYELLKDLGLTTKGLKEKKYETPKQLKKRIEKINIIHKRLMEKMDYNKQLEEKINKLHELISKEKFLK